MLTESLAAAPTWYLTIWLRVTPRHPRMAMECRSLNGAPTTATSVACDSLLAKGESLKSLGENLDLNGAVFPRSLATLRVPLIEHGADVNYPLPDTGETPLHAALCKANRPAYNRVLKVLLANGANPNCATTPDVDTDGFMRDCRTKGETPLHRAAAFRNEEAVQLLLDAGAIVDAKDMHGDSPLTWASWHLRPASILRKLCYGGADSSYNNSTYDHGMGW